MHRPAFEAGTEFIWGIVLLETHELIGAIELSIDAEHERAEMGYWIGKPYWKMGYATEAAEEVLHHAFYVIGLNRVFASHLLRNPASGRVMEKIGMLYEGTLYDHTKRWGLFETVKLYGILKDEFVGKE